MPSSKDQLYRPAQKGNAAITEFKSVLRIRPLLKKERDDHVALEPMECGYSVALHPPLVKDPTEATVRTGQDVEFHFDRVFAATASQDKVYAAVGQPMALQAMESLKSTDNHHKKKTHLIIGIGLAASGTTYSCTGNQVSKRKSDSDGLVPRILDSLYSQSKHNVVRNTNKKVTFAVKLTVLQVNQSKTNPSDCQIYDLLQPVQKSTSAVETLGSGINNLASTILGSMDLSNGSTSNSKTKSNFTALNETVKVQQDVVGECFLVNSTVQTCYTQEDARESLQKAVHHSRQLSHKKFQSHMLVQVQPVLVSTRSGRTLQQGEVMAVLDMASCENNKQRAARLREPHRADAHTAVMHCLKAIQHNEAILTGRMAYDDDSVDQRKRHSLRKVPFLQHQVTMLLQPLFGAAHTAVTLLVTVSPSNRDYAEKKLLLAELLALYSPAPVTAVSTGVGATNISSAANKKEVYTKIKELKKATHRHAASELDDKVLSQENRSINHTESAYDTGLLSSPKHLERVHSMTYSDSTGEDDDKDRFVQLPPPVAPGYKDTLAMKQHTFPPQASAPMEELKVPPPILTVDFPGLPMPPSSIQSALTETLSPSDFKSKALAETPSPSTSKSPAQTYEQEAYPVLAEAFPEPKFNYMKTINKVVHASKKKGRKVMERMTVTTISSDHQLQQRVADLEKQNEALMRENVALFEKNQQLQQLNDWLQNDKSKEIHVHEIETISSESTETKHDPPRRQKTETTPLVDMVARQESRCDEACDSIKDRRVSVGTTISEQECTNAPDQMYDNPLFRHMATMNNQSTSRWNRSNAKAHVMHSYERSYDLEDGDAFSEDSNDENDPDSKEVGGQTTLFDDPLLQHMAMMNNM